MKRKTIHQSWNIYLPWCFNFLRGIIPSFFSFYWIIWAILVNIAGMWIWPKTRYDLPFPCFSFQFVKDCPKESVKGMCSKRYNYGVLLYHPRALPWVSAFYIKISPTASMLGNICVVALHFFFPANYQLYASDFNWCEGLKNYILN